MAVSENVNLGMKISVSPLNRKLDVVMGSCPCKADSGGAMFRRIVSRVGWKA